MVLTDVQMCAMRRSLLADLWADWTRAENAALRAPTGSGAETRWFERLEHLETKIGELSIE